MAVRGSPLVSLGARTFYDFWGMDGRGSSEDSSAQVVLILVIYRAP
ncbi:MAG: hypothetical protein RIQ73_156 [Actinomycetota bacterium]|jgi:hypothetical protein